MPLFHFFRRWCCLPLLVGGNFLVYIVPDYCHQSACECDEFGKCLDEICCQNGKYERRNPNNCDTKTHFFGGWLEKGYDEAYADGYAHII